MKLSAMETIQLPFSWNTIKAPVLPKALVSVCRCFQVYRQRQQLLNLTDEQLQDIGVSRRQAEAEAGKSFWDIPQQSRQW